MTLLATAAPPVSYPFTLGMLVVVNPCGFALLPAYLDFFARRRGVDDTVVRRGVEAIVAAALATVGFVALFAALGVVSEERWSSVVDLTVTVGHYAMVVVGAAIVAVGVAAISRRPLRLGTTDLRSRVERHRSILSMAFGACFGLASVGCSLPLFVAGVAAPFSGSNAGPGVGGFLAYALGAGTLLCGLSLGLAALESGADRVRGRGRARMSALGGGLLVATGAYVTWYWLTVIAAPDRSFAGQRWVSGVQQHVSASLDAHVMLVGTVFTALLVGAIVVGGARPTRPASRWERG